ncbi:GAF domain-containing SpoIIE family protein phosphatase [Streptomyces apricus]|uniref:GAF domain-containing protein n=1 Tax=Streptomyces apricus TaxID=1828112 RepID=A0A5B0BQN5_9ACTN|nr:SpoIIE family protein phosphatase [Streptomyces apricus]KAA0943135.1 GAF domain-containing protein [Streptomyces apricus]
MTDPARIAALRDTGLSARADAGMDRFARLVAELLDVPVALVSLVDSGEQFFPGMVGLDDPWASARQTPLTHSLCRHVVADSAPLVVSDARADTRTRESLAIPELNVIGYAGMPLTDTDGHVLGSLCAIDNRPRQWSARELRVLEDLAAACSADLQLRVASLQREQARERAAELSRRLETALERSQLLLRSADALADTTGLAEVRQQIRNVITGDLKPTYVGLVLAEERGRMRRLIDTAGTAPMEKSYERYGLDDAWPTARAARENRTITVDSPAQLERDYAPEAVEAFTSLGLSSAVCVPLPGTVIPLGTLVLGWDRPHEIDIMEQAILTSLAGYTARAVERALFVDNRINTARQMQEALLTDLPTVPGLELAALYRPAAAGDLVGGDWYDAYLLPATTPAEAGKPKAAASGRPDTCPAGTAVLSVGDVTGHDMQAATLMGQARSMLRQAGLDHLGRGPACAVSAFEQANAHLGIEASGSLVHAHLRPGTSAREGWELTWTNAGHPPPLLVGPTGTATERLHEHDAIFHPGLGAPARTEHQRHLSPGSLLLLYTDGLVERRGSTIDTNIDATGRVLAAHRHAPLPELLTTLADTVAGADADDDIALLALRIPRPPDR